MRTNDVTLDRLDRQRSLIDMVSSRIEERAARGEHVSLSRSMLDHEKRLYRSMLSRAPLHVLDAHTSDSRFT